MASPNEISISQLNRLVGTPDCPKLIDLRIDEDHDSDPHLIPSAVRVPFTQMEVLARECQGQKLVVYCHKGLKISQGSAAMLRHYGVQTESVEGGHVAWREAGLPMVPAVKIPTLDTSGSTVWVTRQRPKVDRIACAWLIRRFVDPTAKFLFVTPSQVDNVAEKFDATPFDVAGVFWSHRDDNCTFDKMVNEFGLSSEALNRLALIVRAADTDKLDLAPQASGLLAASLGLSRMYKDDLKQLEAGMGLYDAFYRWSRDAVSESHVHD